MLSQIDPSTTDTWEKLKNHYRNVRSLHMKDLFAQDPARFDAFSIQFEDIVVDYSKNRITAETLRLLLELADACEVRDAAESMFSGEPIN